MRKLIIILGIPIDDLNMTSVMERLERFIQVGRSMQKTHQIVTVNTDFIVKSAHDPELRFLLQEADLATADGMPLVWGARLLGVDLKERVTGADLVPALAKTAAEKGYSIYLLGAGPGVAEKAGKVMQERYPGLKIAGVQSPPFQPIEATDPAIIDEIRAAQPDILMVALGNPKQEKWIQRFGPVLGVPVMIGVGGSLDFIAGVTRRAPDWMQRSGLEWFYRLTQEPKRLWKRYFNDLFVFTWLFARQLWAMRHSLLRTDHLPFTDFFIMKDATMINVHGRLTVANVEDFRETSRKVLAVSQNVIINLEKATFLDSSAIGALVGLAKEVRANGGELWLVSVPETIEQTLKLLRLDAFFSIHPDIQSCLAARRTQTAAGRLIPLTRVQP